MTIAEQITELFPIRKSTAQKKAFRQWVMGEMTNMGYAARVEQSDKGRQQNIVIGDPDHAEVILTAHYDTPATVLLPELQIPRNFAVYLLWQIGMIGGMLLLSLVCGAALGLLTQNGDVMIVTFFLVFVGLMWLQLYGFANPHNVNDNTSGVAALLETMALIPEEQRGKNPMEGKVAFILFDNCEKGRKGSKAYARDHIEMQHTRLVVNLDSVGVGEHIIVSAPSLAVQLPQYSLLEKALTEQSELSAHFYSSVTTRGSSDFRSFKCGVGITCVRQVGGVGFYLGDLHTPRDTQADQGNITCLSKALAGYVSAL